MKNQKDKNKKQQFNSCMREIGSQHLTLEKKYCVTNNGAIPLKLSHIHTSFPYEVPPSLSLSCTLTWRKQEETHQNNEFGIVVFQTSQVPSLSKNRTLDFQNTFSEQKTYLTELFWLSTNLSITLTSIYASYNGKNSSCRVIIYWY